jgi:hypothetical protein
MSKQFPECPLYNHNNCRELHHPNFCAIVRKDKACLKKHQKSRNAHAEFKDTVKRIRDKEPELEAILKRDPELTLKQTNRINIANCKLLALEHNLHIHVERCEYVYRYDVHDFSGQFLGCRRNAKNLMNLLKKIIDTKERIGTDYGRPGRVPGKTED